MVEIAATITVLGLALLMSVPNFASAASGGRMGGTSFSSKKSSASSSVSSYRSYSVVRRRNYVAAADSYYSARRNYFSPASEPHDEYDANTGCFLIMLFGFICVCVIFSGYSEMIELLCPPDKTTTVLKLQVGLLAPERSLQKYLNKIAETADTSTPEGLHYILRETVRALLRYHDYCISAHSSFDVKKKMKGEKRFNQLSIEERVKFDEETLVNFNNMKRQNSTIRRFRPSGFANKHIVVTILVAAGGKHKLPCINNSEDLKKALQKLASIPSTRTQAVEVLWTPQDDGDTLSEQELLEDYPLLRSFQQCKV